MCVVFDAKKDGAPSPSGTGFSFFDFFHEVSFEEFIENVCDGGSVESGDVGDLSSRDHWLSVQGCHNQ